MPEAVPPAGVINHLLARGLKYAPAVSVAKMAMYDRVARYIGRIHSGLFEQPACPQSSVEQVKVANGAINSLIAYRPVQKVLGNRIAPLAAVVAHYINGYLLISRFGVHRCV